MLKEEILKIITRGVDESLTIGAYVSPVDFVKEINFSHDLSARQKEIDLSLTPYLIPILEAAEFRDKGAREITFCAVEQIGKSLSYQIVLLWGFLFEPCLSMVVYPSDSKCEEVNRTKILPLIRSHKTLGVEIDMPNRVTQNRYSFSSFTSYFSGSGSRITSHPCRIMIADEIDDWIDHDGQAAKLEDLRKRTRTFKDSLFMKVSSPKGETSRIFKEFLEGSQGYWHLRCQKCRKASIRSCDIHNLKFQIDEDDKGNKILVPGTERLVCPICDYEHCESQKVKMISEGCYIHKRPEETLHLSFQVGALASQWESLSWGAIAKAQLKAGKTGSYQSQVLFDNSFRGLPFKKRKNSKEAEDGIMKHCVKKIVEPQDIEIIILTADTQQIGWKYELRALGVDGGRYQLDFGLCEYLSLTDDKKEKLILQHEHEEKQTGLKYKLPRTLEDILEEGWQGLKVNFCLIDEGGHRQKDVDIFVSEHKRAFSYKGGLKINDKTWEWSKNKNKLILARRGDFQAELLYLLHFAEKGILGEWHLLPEDKITDSYITEVNAVQKVVNTDGKLLKKDGEELAAWDHCGRVHDYFDTGLIYLVAESVCIKYLADREFQHGKAPCLALKEPNYLKGKDKPVEDVKEEIKPMPKKNWVNSWRK
jgi:hypothetical protein